MTRRRSQTRARSRKKARDRRRRAGRFRLYRGIGVTLFVVALALALHQYVSVTSRFGDRIWPIPSQIYSDVLPLAPGAPLSVSDLAGRLEASGYVRVEGTPARQGQYRRLGSTIEAYIRDFEGPTHATEARALQIQFSENHVRSIRGMDGRRQSRAILEPLLLATLYGPRQEERQLVRLDEVPETFRQAVLAAEDARFYSHLGLDLRGILRAAWANVRQGRIVQGGSTITQQTVKNLYLGQQRTWWRKFRETGLSLIVDARFSKDEILEVYLNEVYLGQRGSVAVCGVDAAARFYFGLPFRDLSLGEWALLAGMIRSPGNYNPLVHPDRAIERRRQILDAMQRLGYVEPSDVETASAEPLRLAKRTRRRSRAPYAVDFVQAQLAELYPRSVLNAQGLKIYTTLDPRLQANAESALDAGLERLERDFPAVRRQAEQRDLQGAIVVTDPSTGAILAMVGGRDYGQSQFNRAAQARRQPGSCFKPLVFAAGFELALEGKPNGLTPASVLEDQPIELVSGGKTWRPANYDEEFRGTVTVRQAIENSLNVPTVRAAQSVGVEQVVETARRCGIGSPMAPLPSLALGTAEVSPLELSTAYGTFANGGVRISPWMIRAVTDADGNYLEGQGVARERAISPQTAFLISDLLHGVFERGTARSASAHGFSGGAAGKTGTTDGTRDSWFAGYTNQILALVWVGYDDNARTGLTGATGALPVWVEFMKRSAQRSPLRLRLPTGIVTRKIDAESGQLARSGCSTVYREHFARGTEPHNDCPLHQGRFKNWIKKFLGKEKKKKGEPPGV